MVNKEIGSEFWNIPGRDAGKAYLLSGRTALDYILRDIKKEKKIESAVIPGYCCHTMIEPFIRNGIRVKFYDTIPQSDGGLRAIVPKADKHELFYAMNYFGFAQMGGIDWNKIRTEYEVILEDATHSAWDNHIVPDWDYRYTSHRKWGGLYGIATAEKRDGEFAVQTNGTCAMYSAMRAKAYELKRQYIEDGIGEKAIYMKLFAEAEELLEDDYVGYEATAEGYRQLMSVNWSELRDKRRRNAKILMEELNDLPNLTLMFREIAETDTPLFVPILMKEGRDELRRHLIEHKVYCPVHWPLSEYHKGISKDTKAVYHQEMSLICDQRYDERDMENVVRLIREFF